MLTLYRGITVPITELDNTIVSIKANGLQKIHGTYSGAFINHRPRIAELLSNRDLSTCDTRPFIKIITNGGFRIEYIEAEDSIYACGDEYGASYYACRHNTAPGHVPLLIEFNAKIDMVQIDGRDFLYNFIFQAKTLNAIQRQVVRQCWGDAIDKYIDAALERDDQLQKIAIADLAIQDDDVVVSHHKNKLIIYGRYQTQFCSAFMVKIPISPDQITRISTPEFSPLPPDINIESFRNLN